MKFISWSYPTQGLRICFLSISLFSSLALSPAHSPLNPCPNSQQIVIVILLYSYCIYTEHINIIFLIRTCESMTSHFEWWHTEHMRERAWYVNIWNKAKGSSGEAVALQAFQTRRSRWESVVVLLWYMALFWVLFWNLNITDFCDIKAKVQSN